MNKFLLLLFLAVNVLFCSAQVTVTEYKVVHNISPTDKSFIPFFKIHKDQAFSSQLNHTTLTDLFDDQPFYADTLKHIVYDTFRQAMDPFMNMLGYKIYKNTPLVLSFNISGVGCGVYCEEFNKYYTFDLRNKRQLTLNDFFTQQGQKRLLDSIITYKKNVIGNYLKDSASIETDTILNYISSQDIIAEYKNCLGSSNLENLGEVMYYLDGQKIHTIQERCFPHFMMVADSLWTFQYEIDLNEWKKYLSPLGLSVLH
jgi:hypothetical protein